VPNANERADLPLENKLGTPDQRLQVPTWSDDDNDEFDGEQHIGRIVWSYAGPRERPWVWSITSRFPQAPKNRGAAASREAAMAEFKARWTDEKP
jgi:hypothetical protein